MSTISVVVSARNEATRLPDCLKSVSWADQIIVVDNESTDLTSDVAKKYGATVYSRKNDLMLNRNKNFGFTKASSDWILSLDADEVVTNELHKEIRDVVQNALNTTIDGYWLKRRNIIFGKWIRYGLWWPDRQLRLFRRGLGAFPCIHVHEYLKVMGSVGELSEPFVHQNYSTITQFLDKLMLYTANEADNLANTGYIVTWQDAIRFPVSDFVKIFFAQEGYKDGLHGLVLSGLQSFYSFIVFCRLWEKNKFDERSVTIQAYSREFRKSRKDFSHWEGMSRMKEADNPIAIFGERVKKFLAEKIFSAF